MTGVMIIDIAEHKRLKQHAYLSWAGIVVSSIMLAVIFYLIGVIHGQWKMLDKLQTLEHKVEATQELQISETENFIKATKAQMAASDLLITWGSLTAEKSKIIEQNRGFAKK